MAPSSNCPSCLKRHRVLDSPVTERLVNAWPGLRKRHSLGRVVGGHLYTEWMTVR